MEIVFRTGADKRKHKQILELQKQLDKANEEIRNLKIENGILEIKIQKKERSINYYKKKAGNKNGKTQKECRKSNR